MPRSRKIRKTFKSRPTIEGAGVHLRRAFGSSEVPQFDPFLLLDDFRSRDPRHYLRGFPWHPHRGIETITYVLRGDVEHGDSMGNQGVVGSGDVQWMTAGSGIVHQEMPKGDVEGVMWGFQLWANLPASQKMMTPRYRDVRSDQIPEVSTAGGTRIRVICGEVGGTRGPVQDIVTDPEYLDVSVPAGSECVRPTRPGHTVFAYVLEGNALFGQQGTRVSHESLVQFDDGEELVVVTEKEPVRFLLVSGKPLGEPVAWRGPIVMNTEEELRIAFEEYRNGTFLKSEKA